jgi:hypothetical protein
MRRFLFGLVVAVAVGTVSYVGLRLIGGAIKWSDIRVYLSRLTGNFIPPPKNVIPCKIDPDDIEGVDLRCETYCGPNALYKGSTANQAFINGKTWYFCCPKGYTPTGVNPDPATGLKREVRCIKN